MEPENQASDIEQRRENKRLIDYLNGLKSDAISKQPAKEFKRYDIYYSARYSKDNQNKNLANNLNICKPIVETKATMVTDALITTSVRPSAMSLIDNQNDMDTFYRVAEILDNGVSHVFRINDKDSFDQKILRSALKCGPGIAELSWDPQMSNGIGDISLRMVNPEDFIPDPSAKTVEECNYIFVRTIYSKFTAKKMWPQFSERIDQVADEGDKSEDKAGIGAKVRGVINGIIGANAQQMYVYDSVSGVKGARKNITIWKCYIKDDSPFIPDKDDDPDQREMKEQQFKYPYGRCVVYAGEDLILDDKPIDYPFGFPFEMIYDVETDDIWGQGEIEDLIEIQDRINLAYWRIAQLVREYLSAVLFEVVGGDLNRKSFPGQFSIMLPPGTFAAGSEPRVLTNNTLSELKAMWEYIDQLKGSAYEIARINKMMVTGERSSGVNSGQMVQDLNESPMAGIRGLQRNYKDFLVRLTNKIIVMIQLYYNVPRMIRIGEGKKFAQIPARDSGIEPQITMIERKNDEDLVTEIKGDLSIGEYEVEVTAGSEMPRSKSAIAQLTLQMAEAGYLGDPNDIFVKEKVLQSVQFPNSREIINHLMEEKEKIEKAPPNIASLLEKLTGSLKDLPPDALSYLLQQAGWPPATTAAPPETIIPEKKTNE